MNRISSFGFGAFLSIVSLGVLAACGSSSGGTGGNAGSGGTATTSSSSSSSTSSSSSSSSGAGGGCHGDATAWATLTQGPIPCTQNSDCCVIINGCTNEAQIVSAANKAQAKAAWPYCDNDCTDCIPPAIEVGCVSGVCGGQAVIAPPDASTNLLTDHCGAVPVGATPDKLHFTCGGG